MDRLILAEIGSFETRSREMRLDEMHHDEILARARTGCMPSFGELVGRYERRLTRYVEDILCRRRGRVRRGDADDIMQETWLRVLRSLDRYDARWAFSTWLFTIARRSSLNQLRAAGRARALEAAAARHTEDDPLPEPQARAIEVEQKQRLWSIVSGLPQRQATAVRLHYGEGMGIDDIAVATGTSPGAVKLCLFRARQRLAAAITTGFLVAMTAMLTALSGPGRSTSQPDVIATGVGPVSIELLPTPTDLREALLQQGSAVAGRALGLPAWNEVLAFASLDAASLDDTTSLDDPLGTGAESAARLH